MRLHDSAVRRKQVHAGGRCALNDIELRDGQQWTLPKHKKPSRIIFEAGAVLVDYTDRAGIRQTRTVQEFEDWVRRYGAKAE